MTDTAIPTAPLSTPAPRLAPLPDIIGAESLNFLSGAPGVGKTALLAYIAKQFRDGLPIFGRTPSQLPGIGYINADRGWHDSAGMWFRRVGFPDVQHYSLADDLSFDPRVLRRKFDRTSLLMSFIDKLTLPPGSLVFVDPISLFLGGNLMDYDGCACATHEIRAGMRQRGHSIVASAHSSKLKADKKERYVRLQDQILGSTALLGFSDTQLCLASPEETGKSTYSFLWNPHTAPAELFALERDDQGLFKLSSGEDTNTQLRVLSLFPEEPGQAITIGALLHLAQAFPISKRTLTRAIEKLIELGKVSKVSRGIYVRVPPVTAH